MTILCLSLPSVSWVFWRNLIKGPSLFWYATQRTLVVGYRRFGTAYRTHFQQSSSSFYLYCLTLEHGTVGCPETSVTNYQPTLRNITEERGPRPHRGGSLKSHRVWWNFTLKEIWKESVNLWIGEEYWSAGGGRSSQKANKNCTWRYNEYYCDHRLIATFVKYYIVKTWKNTSFVHHYNRRNGYTVICSRTCWNINLIQIELPWRLSQHVPPKRRNKLIILHSVTTQKTIIWSSLLPHIQG